MKKTILSVNQIELLENIIVKHGQIVTFDQIRELTRDKMGYQQTKNLITLLTRNGWLVRIKRGLYGLTDISNRGFLSLSPYIVANFLVPDSYVSFESALAYHGMFDQLTGKIISVSSKSYKSVVINQAEYDFVKTKADFYFGWDEITIDGKIAKIATAEKALIDMVNFHKNKLAIDIVIEKINEHKNDLNFYRLNEYLMKFSTTTIIIFGFIFDLLKIDSSKLYDLYKNNTGTYRMTAGDKKFNAKWRLYYDKYFDKYKRVLKKYHL